jgi:gliding motility-associated-like protein
LTFSPTDNQTVKITATDPTQTCSGTDEVMVKVLEKLEFFNLFTPNGDASNEVWKIKGSRVNMKINIFDRWGKKVYDGVSQGDVAWDGKEAENHGLYFYLIEHPTDGRKWNGWLNVVKNN